MNKKPPKEARMGTSHEARPIASFGRAWRQDEHPRRTVESLTSRWLGIGKEDDTVDLGTLQDLLDGQTVAFKILKSTDKQLVLDIEKYPRSLPVAIGTAALAVLDVTINIMRLQNELACMQEILEAICKESK